MGSDISFRCLGGNQYQVVVTVYRDCSGISMPTSIPVDITSTCGNQTVTAALNSGQSGQEVSQLCPTAVSTCSGGLLPGVQVYTYVATVTVNPNCGVYTFSYDECCRNPSNNIVNPTSQWFLVRATLNSNAVVCNNAPTFTSLPVPYFCINQPVNYSHGAIDVDGDSLVYSLIAPLNNTGNNIPYTGTFTATNPMPTASGFNFDSQTGQMSFTPTQTGVYVVDVLVQEYRNGVLIGTTMRDIQIVIINCNNAPPAVNNCLNLQNVTGGVVIDCNSLGVCPGQNVSFTIGARDPNGQPITVSSNIAQSIPGATLTTIPGPTPDSIRVNFSWTPTATDTGFRYFTVQFADNACPIPGIQLFTYDITVLDGTDAGPDRFYCTGGGPIQVNVIGGNQFSWNNTVGMVSANADSSVVFLAPSQTTTYIVQSDLQGGCKNRDTITVFNVPTFTTSTSASPDTICLNQTSTVGVTATPTSEGPFTYNWSAPSGIVTSPSQQSTSVRPISSTTYIVTVTSASGCTVRDSVQVFINGVGPKITVTPSANYVCPGDAVTLNSLVKAFDCGPVSDPTNPCLPGSQFQIQTLGNGTNNTTVTPYRGFWADGRVQYIYRASELQALGLSAGAITDVAFNVTSLGNSSPYNNFNVKMGCTSLNQLTTSYVQGLTQVVNNTTLVVNATGWVTHTLDIPYNWDGFSNLIIEVCFDNTSWVSPSNFDGVSSTAAFTGATLYANSDAQSNCGFTTGTLSNLRPDTRFIMCTAPLNNYNFTWVGSNGSTLPNVPNPTTNVFNNVNYTVTIDDGTCQGDTTISLFIDTSVIILASPDTVVCSGDSIQLNAFLPFPSVPFCIPGYNITPIPFSTITPITQPLIGPSGDDVMSPAYQIGFPFQFYCQTYNTFNISTNGFITFTPGQATGITAQVLPNAAAPNNLIAMCWRDLVSGTGVISYFVSGTAPNRVLVVRFTNATFFGNTGNVTGQIRLYETTNVIEVYIQSNTSNNLVATLGVENANGTLGTAPAGFNAAGWSVPASSPIGFRFTPQSAGNALVGVQWTPATGLSNPNILNPKAAPSSTTQYVIAATFSNGCVNRDTVDVVIGNFPYTLSASPDSICTGSSSQLNFAGNGVSYTWTPSSTLSDATIANPVATPTANTTYFVTAFDSLGCRVDDSVNVVVRTHPAITLGNPQTICPYDSVTLTPSGAPYVSYAWSTGATTPSITTSNQTNPQQEYWVVVNDGNCFYSSDTVTITEYVLPPIVVNPSGDTAICVGESIVLAADPGFASYVWSNGSTTQQITVSTAGSYSYIAIDQNGCVLASQDTANVIIVLPPAADIVTTDDTICAGQTTATLSVVPVSGITYTWNPGAIQATSTTVSSAGVYTLIASDRGCLNFDTVEIFSTNPPVVNLGADQNICSCDTTVVLTTGINGTYNWSTGATTADLSVTATGVYTVTVTDFNQCTATDNIDIAIRCLTADASSEPATSVLAGQSATLDVTTSYAGNFSYSWSPSTALDDSTKKSPYIMSAQETTTYQVIVTDVVNGCIASDTIRLSVLPPGVPPMPNAFTPNGDGVNDTYGPYFPPALQGVYSIANFRIYNRWGQLLYNGTTNWDGNYNGVPQPVDTYLYYITLEGPDQNNPNQTVQYNLFGSFTLLH